MITISRSYIRSLTLPPFKKRMLTHFGAFELIQCVEQHIVSGGDILDFWHALCKTSIGKDLLRQKPIDLQNAFTVQFFREDLQNLVDVVTKVMHKVHR
jgi:hypothetical protein